MQKKHDNHKFTISSTTVPFVSLTILILLLVISKSAEADLISIKVNVGDSLETKREVKELALAKTDYISFKYDSCLRRISKVESKYVDLNKWLALQKILCAKGAFEKEGKKYEGSLRSAIQNVWKNSDWVLVGPQIKKLRAAVVDGSLALLDIEVKTNRERAWGELSRLIDVREWLTSSERGRLFRLAGDLSFAAQNLEASRDYYERSLKEEYNKQAQVRLESILNSLDPDRKKLEKLSAEVTDQSSPEENEIYMRLVRMHDSGDLVSAVEDALKLILQFPGSKNANDAARRVISIYVNVATKKEEKYIVLKDRIFKEIKKADGQRLFDWAQILANRELFSDTVELTQGSLDQLKGQPVSTAVLLLSANSAYNSANFKFAKIQYEKLIHEHAGTRAAAEARFRLGLAEFREKNYAESASHFERYLQLEWNTDFELSSYYWLWRSLQKIEVNNKNIELNRSQSVAERLIEKYPLSYYGLRARIELNGNKIELPEKPKSLRSWNLNLAQSERDSWERFKILIKANWIEEAQSELGFLTEPSSAENKIAYAYILSVAQNFHSTAEVLNRSFGIDPNLVSRSTLRLGYPQPFMNELKFEAQKYKIPINLLFGLIKQESSFRVEVSSPVGAMGLMQLMPVTAREVATDLRIKVNQLDEDLANPKINIKIGSQYLFRRIKAFEGNVPLALASYNAGIGNIRSWLRSRSDLAEIAKTHSSEPSNELWFDELPWAETSAYIKSILRNYLVYSALDQKKPYFAEDPLWNLKINGAGG